MLSLIDKLLDEDKGVIVLLPEIALTPQSVAIFCARYGDRVAVIHSGLSAGERYDAYCRIREGNADVVIGTRSAVFSPVKNLGAIIIDEGKIVAAACILPLPKRTTVDSELGTRHRAAVGISEVSDAITMRGT